MKVRWIILLVAAAALMSGIQLYAHHSFAATYFEDKQQTIEGDLVQFLFRNPHSFVHVEGKDEKGETVRWQPVTATLMAHLQQHADTRHAPRNGQLLRYADGRPITTRRYDHLWARLGQHLPWVATQQISTHWLGW